jgi:ubiquinone/menaquinone biosynthesis C-methylase UbiE
LSGRTFDLVFGPWLGILHRRARRLVEPAPGCRVLEIGCGTALQLRRYRGDGRRLVGLDLDPEMLARARVNLGADGALFQGDAGALPFADGSFDLVLGSLMLHEMPTAVRDATMAEARRVLAPGGSVLLVDFAARRDPRFGHGFYRWLIGRIERGVGGVHYKGYLDFMARDGLAPLIEEAGLTVVRGDTAGRGAIELLLLEAR